MLTRTTNSHALHDQFDQVVNESRRLLNAIRIARWLMFWLLAVLAFILLDALWPLPAVARLVLLILSVISIPACWLWLSPSPVHSEQQQRRRLFRAIEIRHDLPHHPFTTGLQLLAPLSASFPKPGMYTPGSRVCDDQSLTCALSQRATEHARSTLDQMPGPWMENKRAVRRHGLLLGATTLIWFVLAMSYPAMIGGQLNRLVDPLGEVHQSMIVPRANTAIAGTPSPFIENSTPSRNSTPAKRQPTNASAGLIQSQPGTTEGGHLDSDLAKLHDQVRRLIVQAQRFSGNAENSSQHRQLSHAPKNWSNHARQAAHHAREIAEHISNQALQTALSELAKTLERMSIGMNVSFANSALRLVTPFTANQADAGRLRTSARAVSAIQRRLIRLQQAIQGSTRGRSTRLPAPTMGQMNSTIKPTPATGSTMERQNTTDTNRTPERTQAMSRKVPPRYQDLTAAYFQVIHTDDRRSANEHAHTDEDKTK